MRPTMPGVNSFAVGRYRPEGAAGYVAMFHDGTTGPLRSVRPEAERDYRKEARR